MAIFLDRIDSVPVDDLPVPYEFKQWVTNLVDSLNYSLEIIGDNIDPRGGDLTWQTITVDTQGLVNHGYITNSASQVKVTLPATCNAGDIVRVIGIGAGGWQILANTGQNMSIIHTTGTTSITSSSQFDAIELICTTNNTSWVVGSLMTTGVDII